MGCEQHRYIPAVYGIRCKENGKVYIGSTTRFNQRFTVHLGKMKAGKGINKKIQDDYDKYGPECFEYFICERLPDGITKDQRQERELHFCHEYNSFDAGYNYKDPVTGSFVRKANRADTMPSAWKDIPIVILDRVGNITEAQCPTEASIITGVDKKNIGKVRKYWKDPCNPTGNQRKSYKGYIFIDKEYYKEGFDYWGWHKVSGYTPRKKLSDTDMRPIVVTNIDSGKSQQFSSPIEASEKLLVNLSRIMSCLNHQREFYYRCTYAFA